MPLIPNTIYHGDALATMRSWPDILKTLYCRIPVQVEICPRILCGTLYIRRLYFYRPYGSVGSIPYIPSGGIV